MPLLSITICPCNVPLLTVYVATNSVWNMHYRVPQGATLHNEVRDLTASMLREMCHDVQVEPHLQSLTGETMAHKTTNTDPGARLDISACSVWGGQFERTFFDVRVFNPIAQSNCATSLKSTYHKHKLEKKRHYEDRILEVERSSFTPLVMSAIGGMGPLATNFHPMGQMQTEL